MMSARLILSLFIERDIGELRAIRDGQFTAVQQGQGMMISSSVNGSDFSFFAASMLSPLQVAQYAQLAIDHKANCWQRPTTKTTVRFM
jgi:hypothetical protein